jgi:D-psicose/D-tagatose/L-ribulose 3-epimerase
MNVSVSNISWGSIKNNFKYFKYLKTIGIKFVELAPSLCFENINNVTAEQINTFKKQFQKNNLKFIGFHSLFFGNRDLHFFQSKKKLNNLKNQLIVLIKLCKSLGGKNLVLGSPKNRTVGKKNYNNCKILFKKFLLEIEPILKKNKLNLLIEPLAKPESDFLTSMKEGAELIKSINKKNIKLHLDTKTLILSKENLKYFFKKYFYLVKHMHVSDVGLLVPGTINNEHVTIGSYIKKISYKGFITLEIKKTANPKKSIKKGIIYIKSNYV